jgi:hypothetical protein
LVVLGLVTLFHVTATAPDGAVLFDALTMRSSFADDVLTVQPLAAPRPVGCEARVELLAEKPEGALQLPEAAVQNWTFSDLTAVEVGRAAVDRAYDAVAPADELLNTIDRPVIGAAEAVGVTTATMRATAAKPLNRVVSF